MKRHILKHTGEKPYHCQFCQYSFSRKDKLREHNFSKHNFSKHKVEWFHWNRDTYFWQTSILIPEQLFGNDFNENLWFQTSPIKMGPYQYGCPLCQNIQKSSWLMKRHILRHTKEKPFGCQLCQYASSRKDQLGSHITYKHKQ